MLTRLFLRLKGDVVGALLHERQAALKVFISAKESLKRVVEGLDAEVAKIDEKLIELGNAKLLAQSHANNVEAQLSKLSELI